MYKRYFNTCCFWYLLVLLKMFYKDIMTKDKNYITYLNDRKKYLKHTNQNFHIRPKNTYTKRWLEKLIHLTRSLHAEEDTISDPHCFHIDWSAQVSNNKKATKYQDNWFLMACQSTEGYCIK